MYIFIRNKAIKGGQRSARHVCTGAIGPSAGESSYSASKHSTPSTPDSVQPAGEYLSVQEVALRLNVSEQTVRSEISSGRLPALKVGRVYRIAKTSIDSLAVTRTQVAPARRRRSTKRAAQGKFSARARKATGYER
jgi:excisionase family DNA binding protein